ncbi:2-oxoglutarate-dependent dioxygenase DAO-like [Rutidosis leptorrhynchoides]|uniref:2-oxoglutarate-dependent dioxygenase DAO-like n=1 Tax=Rutidosis leptorrhynchoides TaxID=125765 RepID=UPI003A99F93F
MGTDHGVPMIDMQKVEGLEDELEKAYEEWGCFRMANHGVPVELLNEMKLVVASLFDLPLDIKMRAIQLGMGYIPRNLATSFYEGFAINDVSSPAEFYDLLEVSPHQREIIYKYIKAIRDLAGHLGRKLMECSGLDGDLFDGWQCQLRMNKYNYSHESVGSKGSEEHTDPSFLTILQDDDDVNGLQVVDKVSGKFVPLDPVPNTLAVNVGDLGKVWSNGKYYNVNHRVLCLEPKTRYSIALFVLGPTQNKLETPPKFIDSEHPQIYIPIDHEEYRRVRTSMRTVQARNGGALALFSAAT